MKRKSPPRLTRSSPSRMHLRLHTRASINELALPLHTTLSSNKQIFDDLVLACFSQMKTSFWYNIIPLDTNDVSDMSSAMGQRWEYLVHLLINAGYLYFKKKLSKYVKMNGITYAYPNRVVIRLILLLINQEILKKRGMSVKAYHVSKDQNSNLKLQLWATWPIKIYEY